MKFADLGDLPAAEAGDAAFRSFCTPAETEWRLPNQRAFSERARFHLRYAMRQQVPTPAGALQTYRFQPDQQPGGGTVMLVHGWTSEAAFMMALAEPIRRAGFQVVLFDLPAHGLSPGRRTNLVDCARATLAMAQAVGPLHAIVAHSFGGMVSLLAAEGRPPMPRKLEVPHVVLIACPNRLSDVTRQFAERRRMTEAGRRAFELRLERVGHRSIRRFATAELLAASRCRALVVHARDDGEVPFQCAEEVTAANPQARMAAFDGFGHRNILFAPPAVRSVVKYLVEGRG